MRTIVCKMILWAACSFSMYSALAQAEWPRSFAGPMGDSLRIYQLQPDSIWDNQLLFHAAFTLTGKNDSETQVGSFQALATMETDRLGHRLWLLHTRLLIIRLTSAGAYGNDLDPVKGAIEKELSGTDKTLSMDRLVSSLCLDPDQYKLYVYGELNYTTPRILLASVPSILVYIDGAARLKWHKGWGIRVVVNSPYTIAVAGDGWHYLYGGRNWYIAPTATGPYFHIRQIPQDLWKMQKAIGTLNNVLPQSSSLRESASLPAIMVTTSRAELIQILGKPVLSQIPGTSLYFITNPSNEIFLDSAAHCYYLLLSGRWFRTSTLTGGWEYVRADALPADFGKIPENSPKAGVLSSVPGTIAALEALMDARIPQTARVDRQTTAEAFIYNGKPQFASIRGTNLEYALNTQAMVMRDPSGYFYVDRGIWFCGNTPAGPWSISTKRPEQVDRIPPDYPAYLSKFVHIYGAAYDYVYAGFTTGYLNSFIDGPVLTYGTGYTYRQQEDDDNYYVRPLTWGFNMRYDPLSGWCLGYDYKPDWLNRSHMTLKDPWSGGWWGPAVYRPPYLSNGWPVYDRAKIAEPVRLYADRKGNIYRRGPAGKWQYNEGTLWKDVMDPDKKTLDRLDREEALQRRGEIRAIHFLAPAAIRQSQNPQIPKSLNP